MIDLAPPLAAFPSQIERIKTSRVSNQSLITNMSPVSKMCLSQLDSELSVSKIVTDWKSLIDTN